MPRELHDRLSIPGSLVGVFLLFTPNVNFS